MKKFILVLIFFMMMSSYAEMWMHGDFEDGTLDGCTLVDNDNDGNGWEAYYYESKFSDEKAVSTLTGNYVAKSASAGLTPDNVIISPRVWCELASTLSIQVGALDPVNYAEHFEILLSFTDTDSASFVSVHEETLTSADWKEIVIDLEPHILAWDEWAWAADIYVAVRHFDSSGQSALLIDDVKVYYEPSFYYGEPPYVILPEGIVAPFSDLNFQWDIWDNSGLQNVNLHYILSDESGSQPEATIPLIVNPDPEFSWTYINELPFPGQPMGTFIEYWAEATDMSGYNIVGKSEHFTVEWGEITFTEGFDEDVVPDGWNRFHTGTTMNGWAYDWETWLTANIYSGANSITSGSQNNTGPIETENYLVTPRLRVDGKAKLKYYVNAETPEGQSESYIVFINNVGGDSASVVDHSDTLFAETIVAGPDDNEWHERVIDLEPWEGQFLWIAIKHLYTPYDDNAKLNRYLNIDEFSIAELPVLEVYDPGNAALPGEDVTVEASASDYSGINNLTIYYTVVGQPESSTVMTDNGDGTFTGIIPGQAEDAKCSWYIVATDDSPYSNQTTSESNSIIWFESGILEWGSEGTAYTDYPEPMNAGTKAGMDWNFGTKGNLYLNQIEIGLEGNAEGLKWKLVEFDGEPTDNVVGSLSGTWDYSTDGKTLLIDGDYTPIYGHVALVFEFDAFNEIMLDEGGNKAHAWQWNNVAGWTTNDWGAFYIKMYVSQYVDIENEIVASETELYQNYPNPFNPETSISFYNRIAGDVNLSVYNVKGEKVAEIINEKMGPGFNKVDFNASGFNSGVYYYTLNTPEKSVTKKMILIK